MQVVKENVLPNYVAEAQASSPTQHNLADYLLEELAHTLWKCVWELWHISSFCAKNMYPLEAFYVLHVFKSIYALLNFPVLFRRNKFIIEVNRNKNAWWLCVATCLEMW